MPFLPSAQFLERIKKSKFLNNLGNVIVFKVLILVTNFAVNVFIARYMGPEDYGVYSFSKRFVEIFFFLSNAGLATILVREYIRHKNDYNPVITAALLFRGIGTLLSLAVILIFFFFKQDDQFQYVLIVSLILILNISNILGPILQSRYEANLISHINFIAIITVSVARLILIYTEADLVYFVSTYVVEASINAIGLIYTVRKKLTVPFKFNLDKEYLRFLAKSSIILIFANIGGIINKRIDLVLIEYFLDYASVGIYAVAARISEAWYFIPVVSHGTIMTLLEKSRIKNKEKFDQRIVQIMAVLIYSSLMFSILTSLFANDIILNLFGPKYILAADVLEIHIWSSVFVFIGSASNLVLVLDNQEKIAASRSLFAGFSNLILNLIFIPKYGIVGSAYATLISYSISATFAYMVFKSTRHITAYQLKALFYPYYFLKIRIKNQ